MIIEFNNFLQNGYETFRIGILYFLLLVSFYLFSSRLIYFILLKFSLTDFKFTTIIYEW